MCKEAAGRATSAERHFKAAACPADKQSGIKERYLAIALYELHAGAIGAWQQGSFPAKHYKRVYQEIMPVAPVAPAALVPREGLLRRVTFSPFRYAWEKYSWQMLCDTNACMLLWFSNACACSICLS